MDICHLYDYEHQARIGAREYAKENCENIKRAMFNNSILRIWTEDGNVHQTFENLTLTTVIKKKVESNGFIIEEDETLKISMPEGTIIIWDENDGFIVPQCQMCTIEELKEELNDIDEIYNPKEEN
mgnify:CR=1 FL=1